MPGVDSECCSDEPMGHYPDSSETVIPSALVVDTPPDCAEDVYLDDTISDVRGDDSEEISEVEQEVTSSQTRKAKRSRPSCENSLEFWASSSLAPTRNGTEVKANGDLSPGAIQIAVAPVRQALP